MDAGTQIREARLAKGWSQAKLAVKAGVGIVTVGNVEHGKGKPTDETLGALCRALGLPFTPSIPARIGPAVDAERGAA